MLSQPTPNRNPLLRLIPLLLCLPLVAAVACTTASADSELSPDFREAMSAMCLSVMDINNEFSEAYDMSKGAKVIVGRLTESFEGNVDIVAALTGLMWHSTDACSIWLEMDLDWLLDQ